MVSRLESSTPTCAAGSQTPSFESGVQQGDVRRSHPVLPPIETAAVRRLAITDPNVTEPASKLSCTCECECVAHVVLKSVVACQRSYLLSSKS